LHGYWWRGDGAVVLQYRVVMFWWWSEATALPGLMGGFARHGRTRCRRSQLREWKFD